MNIISFKVMGKPVPYLRMTQAQIRLSKVANHKLSQLQKAVKKKVIDYLRWKEYVNSHTYGMEIDRNPKSKIYLDIFIYFKDKKHGDPDNIRKGIQDAIFENDRYIAGKVDFLYFPDKEPYTEIYISEKKEYEE